MHSANWWGGRSYAQVSCSAQHPGWPETTWKREAHGKPACAHRSHCAEKPLGNPTPTSLQRVWRQGQEWVRGLSPWVAAWNSSEHHSPWYVVLPKHWRPGGVILEGTNSVSRHLEGTLEASTSTVISPGLRFTGSLAADTAVLWVSRIIQVRPCFCSMLKSRRKFPAPHFPSSNGEMRHHQSYRAIQSCLGKHKTNNRKQAANRFLF